MFNQRDQLRFEITSKAVAGLISIKVAAKTLNVCYRTMIRYKKEFRLRGSAFLIHGNTGHKSYNSVAPEIKKEIMDLVVERYFDFSIKHTWEKLEDHDLQRITYRTLLRWCHEKKYVKKFKTRNSKICKARERMPQRGMMLQMDGSYHQWYGKKKSCLIAAIDDANNEISYAEFFDSETTLDCMRVIQKIIETHGAFDILYTDKAGVYGGNKRQDFCQLEEACKAVGIQIIYAHTAQAKGRIERLWKTLQGRLIPELRLADIITKKQANKFLWETFIPNQYNKKFLVQPTTKENTFRPYIGKDLDQIFSKKEYRVINADQTFNYDSNKYLINGYPGNLRNKMVEVRTYQDRSLGYFWANKELDISEFKIHKIKAA